MRPSTRLYATVKSAARYLEANTPTGLTGLPTHPSPRPALLYTYNKTLEKLRQLPKSSVYRQSCEALTKHRLQIVQDALPPGYEEWLQRTKQLIESDPRFRRFVNADGTIAHEEFVTKQRENWDGLYSKKDAQPEGSNTQSQAEAKAALHKADLERLDREAKEGPEVRISDLETEPALTADQINDLEVKLSAGLIEEVVQVAEGELLLVDEMLASRAWEDLEEKPAPGQWEYFDRGDRV